MLIYRIVNPYIQNESQSYESRLIPALKFFKKFQNAVCKLRILWYCKLQVDLIDFFRNGKAAKRE